MIDREQIRLDLGARLFRALAHPTRLFMLERLAESEHSVGDFVEMIPLDMSTISKHLAVLKQAGIVGYTKKGNQVIYRLKMAWIPGLLQGVESGIEAALKEAGPTLG
jgi:DNA-binding transcriptional ArsR family regulator